MTDPGRVMFAPVGTALTAPGWSDVGVLAEPIRVGIDPDRDDDDAPIVFADLATTFTATLHLHPDTPTDWTRRFGRNPEPPTHALLAEFTDTTLPAAPEKRRGLTGKAYRAARRAHARQARVWRRAGSPMVRRALYFPRVRITPTGARP